MELSTDTILPLAKDEIAFVPPHLAQVTKSSSQTHVLSITLAVTSGVVPILSVDLDGNAEDLDLSGLLGSVEDGPNGEPLFVYKERQSQTFYNPSWKKATAAANMPGSKKEDWNRVLTGFENTVAAHQTKAGDSVYSVAQFQLPFKVLKDIKPTDILSMMDDDGSCSITYKFWHADQSGRNADSITKMAKIVKG